MRQQLAVRNTAWRVASRADGDVERKSGPADPAIQTGASHCPRSRETRPRRGAGDRHRSRYASAAARRPGSLPLHRPARDMVTARRSRRPHVRCTRVHQHGRSEPESAVERDGRTRSDYALGPTHRRLRAAAQLIDSHAHRRAPLVLAQGPAPTRRHRHRDPQAPLRIHPHPGRHRSSTSAPRHVRKGRGAGRHRR